MVITSVNDSVKTFTFFFIDDQEVTNEKTVL